MKDYIKPTVSVIALRPEEAIACTMSCGATKFKGNNGFGNGDQDPPGNSGGNNGAENDQGDKGKGQDKW